MIGDVTHRVFRESALGDFVLEASGRELARATKPSAFRDTIIVHYGGRDYTLLKPSIWRRAFALMDGDRQDRNDRARERLDAACESRILRLTGPMPIQAFVIWLVIILWKRNAQNSAA
jgi:hypothetical protein